MLNYAYDISPWLLLMYHRESCLKLPVVRHATLLQELNELHLPQLLIDIIGNHARWYRA